MREPVSPKIVVTYDNSCYYVTDGSPRVREYDISITVNGRHIKRAVVDPHYELKHSESVSDQIILELIKLLNGGTYPVQERGGPYEYFVTDRLKLDDKLYKLVWLLEDEQLYIGVVNAYRRNQNGVSKRKRIKKD